MRQSHLFDSSQTVCPSCQSPKSTIDIQRNGVELIRCDDCGLVFAWPMTVPDTLYEDAYSDEGHYDYYLANVADAQNNTRHVPWPMRRFLKAVQARGNLLDVGCSTGGFLLEARRFGWEVSGVEISEKAAAIARDLSGAQIRVGSIEDLPKDKQYDAITAWEVLEHVPDPVGFLINTITALRPGGILGLSVPNWDSPWMKRSSDPEHWPPYHLTYWNLKTLKSLFDRLNLNILQIQEKPFAWGEEVGRLKWIALPLSLTRSILLGQKGMHILAIVQRL